MNTGSPAIPLVHFIEWKKISDVDIPRTLNEFAEQGVTQLVAHPCWATREEAEPGYLQRLQTQFQARALTTPAAHALWGSGNDIGCSDPDLWRRAVTHHATFLRQLAEWGTVTYTMHLGLNGTGPEAWEPIQRALDRLLPIAAQTGITLCLENGNEPSTELLCLRNLVAGIRHPQLAICFDTGHAHCYNHEGILYWLELFEPYIQTCHWHDNDGNHDDHRPPGCGTIDWTTVLPRLRSAPQLRHVETESGDWQIKDWLTFRHYWDTMPPA